MKINKTKVVILLLLIFTVVSSCLTGCARTVDEACDWCGDSPSVEYETSDGSKAYVCKECSKMCMICGDNKATKHGENLLGMILFVCDDCYDD